MAEYLPPAGSRTLNKSELTKCTFNAKQTQQLNPITCFHFRNVIIRSELSNVTPWKASKNSLSYY